MNKAEQAWRELASIDELVTQESPLHRMHPAGKLFLAVLFLMLTVSFPKYDFTGLFFYILFPVVGYQVAGIPMRSCFRKLRMLLPFLCAVGIWNPLLDRTILMKIGSVELSGGVISMITLMGKGILCLLASFLLAATTSVGDICYVLRKIHCPKLLVTLFLLTYRYLTVFLREVAVMTESYHLRAPGQKGIHPRAWGSFLGQLLLRTIDRGQALYESMLLRGYDGEFPIAKTKQTGRGELSVVFIVAVLLLVSRVCPVTEFLGSIFVG